MPKRAISATPASKTRAGLAFEKNLGSIGHMFRLRSREIRALKAQALRLTGYVKKRDLKNKTAAANLARSLQRFAKAIQAATEAIQTAGLWQVVMLVTCVEAYMQDVLIAAASVDPELMSKSEQRALYTDIVSAASLEALLNDMRGRWARAWLSGRGPTRWISDLEKMGARGYPDDLALRLERIWGIRHVVVHAAGFATADFVNRHPGLVAGAGDRVPVRNEDFKTFLGAIRDFIKPTEQFFLARYPSLAAVEPKGASDLPNP